MNVAAGEQPIILESMKREIPVVAPIGGTVSALHVKPDDRVREGDVLAHLT